MQSLPSNANVGVEMALASSTSTHQMRTWEPDAQAELAQQFSEFLLGTRPALRAFLSTLLRDRGAIEDCLQDLSLTVWKKFEPTWEEEDFRRYAFTCARFKALSWLKKNKPGTLVFVDPQVAEIVGERILTRAEGSGHRGDERMRALERCVASLSPQQQRVLEARYSSGDHESLAETAKRLSRSLPALYKQLERLRTALKHCVEKRLEQGER